jgi:murein DD-endopeptidase MepM/ murein hydrolase activator NlpD
MQDMTKPRIHAARTLSFLLSVAFVSGCMSKDSGADTSLPVNGPDSSAISDKSLRPPPEGIEPIVALHGMPKQDSASFVRDTIPPFVPVDSALMHRAIDATKSASTPVADVALSANADLAVLRGELTVPIANLPATALHDTYSELRGGTRPHEALDILAPRGTPVLSAAKGRVLKLFNSKPGGLMVYATDSTERFILLYGHLDAYAPGLADGQSLKQGQPIGIVGTTGNAAANTPHLHFAVARAVDVKQWWKGTPVNPYPLLLR